jgi:hypothetical protein
MTGAIPALLSPARLERDAAALARPRRRMRHRRLRAQLALQRFQHLIPYSFFDIERIVWAL